MQHQNFTLTNNLTCAPQKGIKPQFIDYFLEVPTDLNNGHQPPLYLGRSTLDPSRQTPDEDILLSSVSPRLTIFPSPA